MDERATQITEMIANETVDRPPAAKNGCVRTSRGVWRLQAQAVAPHLVPPLVERGYAESVEALTFFL